MDRITRLRERMARAHHARHRILLLQDWSTSGLQGSIPERKALALKLLLQRMPIFIDDDELIVGSRTVFGIRRPGQTAIADPSADVSMLAVFPSYLTDAERAQARAVLGTVPEGTSKGHYVPGYGKVLQLGFGGIRDEAWNRAAKETQPDRRDFLQSVAHAYEGTAILATRYAGLARDTAATQSGARQEELSRIAAVCEHVATRPPRDLHEALQLFWFTCLASLIENQYLVSFGRFDQYMLPFWQSSPTEARQELLECLFIKLNDQADIHQGEGFYGSDNLMLGGLKPDGTDGTNAVTHACLEALDHLRLPNPMLNVRLHKDSPPDFRHRAADLARQGLPQLAFYNDDTVVPALAGAGFAAEEARDYVLDACQDVLIEGRSDFYLGGYVCLTELLLESLREVHDTASFGELMDSYKERIRTAVANAAEAYKRSLANPCFSPLPFLSATLQNCVEKGLDITQGGLKHLDKGMFVMSPVNAANSLAAIRKVVYDDHWATLAEVKAACGGNFDGFAELRQRLLGAPKWGNDDNDVDRLAKDLFEFACHEIQKHRIDADSRFLSGIHQPHHVRVGAGVGATPDGRLAGEPFPVTLAPVNGTERNGPTAVIRSVTRIDPLVCQWNNALTLSFHPTAVRGETGLAAFEALLQTYFSLGGIQLQLNVVDAALLREAQREPDRHRDLVVRVWGFCARFVDLSPQYQEDVIARTAHRL